MGGAFDFWEGRGNFEKKIYNYTYTASLLAPKEKSCKTTLPKSNFTITAEIHARSSVNFYCQYADKYTNLKFIQRVSERERAIRQFVIVKNKLMSDF